MRIRLGLAATLLLTGCDLAPGYRAPPTPPVASYKETGPWVRTTPQTALPRQAWWKVYGDATLDGLEDRIAASNPALAQAQARFMFRETKT